jgi:uncharacterized protein (TIGR04168 family)
MSRHPRTASILVVGDIHRFWRRADRDFLEQGAQDLVMFVGDLGDEDLEMAQEVAELDAKKVVILGNHDAWQSFGRGRPTQRLDRILELLHDDHLGFGVRELPQAGVSIIGARPFSWGGRGLRSIELYRKLYGIDSIEASAERIVEAARRAQHRDVLVLAHNGPSGMSRATSDIWGKDFGDTPGGDWGDDDLQLALRGIEGLGLRVRGVIAGHMHERLSNPRGGTRTRFVRRGATVFVNPAVVPRVRTEAEGVEVSHFVRLSLRAGIVIDVEELWIDQAGSVRATMKPSLRELPEGA